jgi:hypothetical protein
MADEYQILCSIHGLQYVWSDTLVTTCPVNASDPINADATCIVASARICSQLTPVISSTTSLSYIPVMTCVFSPASFGNLKLVRVLSKCISASSYSITVFDKTNSTVLSTSTFTNSDDYILNDLGSFEPVTTDPTIIEIRLKVDGGPIGSTAYISQILFYSY